MNLCRDVVELSTGLSSMMIYWRSTHRRCNTYLRDLFPPKHRAHPISFCHTLKWCARSYCTLNFEYLTNKPLKRSKKKCGTNCLCRLSLWHLFLLITHNSKHSLTFLQKVSSNWENVRMVVTYPQGQRGEETVVNHSSHRTQNPWDHPHIVGT